MQRKQLEIRHERERCKLPLFPAVILRHTDADQMTEGICDQITATLIVGNLPVLDTLICADAVCDGLRYGRFFTNNQSIHYAASFSRRKTCSGSRRLCFTFSLRRATVSMKN